MSKKKNAAWWWQTKTNVSYDELIRNRNTAFLYIRVLYEYKPFKEIEMSKNECSLMVTNEKERQLW